MRREWRMAMMAAMKKVLSPISDAPIMASEDFAFLLTERPGAFLWLGGGAPGKDFGLHHPRYDFNDAVLPVGASFWARLVETRLPRG